MEHDETQPLSSALGALFARKRPNYAPPHIEVSGVDIAAAPLPIENRNVRFIIKGALAVCIKDGQEGAIRDEIEALYNANIDD